MFNVKYAVSLLLVSSVFPLTAPSAHAGTSAQPLLRTVQMKDVRDFAELEQLALAEVPHIKKIEVRDLLLKVDGFNEQGMKTKVYMDRRSGAVLSRELKYDKHGPFGKHGWQFQRGGPAMRPENWPVAPAPAQP